MKTLGWERDVRKAVKFGPTGEVGLELHSSSASVASLEDPTGFFCQKHHLALGFRDKSFVIHSGCVCAGISGGCSSARFVTPCVFSPLSHLLPAPLQVPSSPRYLRIRQPNLEIINLEWDHPEHPNGIITGYTLRYQPCTCHVFFPLRNQEILPFLLFARAGRSMRNWRLP